MKEDREMDALIAELFFRQLRPTKDETEEVLRSDRTVDIRGWTLHRKSGAPIANFSSYYWTPSPYSSSAHHSKQLRARLTERFAVHVVTFSKRHQAPGKRASARLLNEGEVCASFESDTEEMAVALCAVKVAESL